MKATEMKLLTLADDNYELALDILQRSIDEHKDIVVIHSEKYDGRLLDVITSHSGRKYYVFDDYTSGVSSCKLIPEREVLIRDITITEYKE